MSISARAHVKNGLCFIKKNFGALWLMVLKVFVSLIPLGIIIGGSVFSLIEGKLENLMAVDPSNIGILNFVAALLALLFTFLVSSAIGVAIVRSVVLEEPLDTRIFSKIFDKIVLKYLAVSILILLVMMLTMGLSFAMVMVSGVPMYIGLFLIAAPILYLLFRLALITYGVAMGDITSFSGAFKQTAGQVWHVFKVSVLAFLVVVLCQLAVSGVIYLLGFVGGTASMVLTMLVFFVSFVIFLPLQFLWGASISTLYKNIR